MKRVLLLLALSMIFLSSLSCVLKRSSPPPSAISQADKSAGLTGAISAKEPWEEKWARVLEVARREGSVIVYGSGSSGDIRTSLISSFMDKYKIKVEYISASGPQSAQKILAEQRANLYYVDVLIGAGLPAISTLKPAGAFDPLEPSLILPEVIDPQYWLNKTFPWVDREHYVMTFMAYPESMVNTNTELVKPDEIKSY